MKTIAFIFARGGSKGLPRKNIRLLAGKPLIQYSIEAAFESKMIDDVYVSTDDDDIANLAHRLNVKVIDRPSELASDTSAEWLSWCHAINWVFESVGEFDQFVSLPVTSPLRSVDDVENAIIQRQVDNADICIAITPASRSPYFNMVKKLKTGFIDRVNVPETNINRRQDAPDVFDITTSVYVSTPNFILTHEGLFSGNVTSITVPKERSVDIDDIYDFMLAQCILEERHVEE
jgi:CMP-N-acetylneuraminic acid synthetase